MTIALKQSTASQEIPLGYFVDSGDGDAEETGLTISNTDIKLWKTGATTLANKNSGGATHISNGIYYTVLDATDTDTLGSLVVFVHVSGALAVKVECVVYPANVYDSLFSTDKLQVDLREVDATTANKLADYVLKRNMATCRASSDGDKTGRFILQALSLLRNKKSESGGTLTVTQEDDSTADWTAAVTTDAGAVPITALDPT